MRFGVWVWFHKKSGNVDIIHCDGYWREGLGFIVKKVVANCGDLVCLHLGEAHWSGRRHMSPGHQHVQDDHGDDNDLGDFDHHGHNYL